MQVMFGSVAWRSTCSIRQPRKGAGIYRKVAKPNMPEKRNT